MAIKRALDRTAMTAAQAQLARVEADGCADHPHRLALLNAGGPVANPAGREPMATGASASAAVTLATSPGP